MELILPQIKMFIVKTMLAPKAIFIEMELVLNVPNILLAVRNVLEKFQKTKLMNRCYAWNVKAMNIT